MLLKNLYKKSDALLALEKDGGLLAAWNYNKYFFAQDYSQLLSFIYQEKVKPEGSKVFEYISNTKPINLFLDIDISTLSTHFINHVDHIKHIKKVITTFFLTWNVQTRFVILSAHCDKKKSYHIICKLTDANDCPLYLKNVDVAKKLVKSFNFETDLSVYREGIFRTIWSSKPNENRPFKPDVLSDTFDEIESFVRYCPGGCFFNVPIDDKQVELPLVTTTTTRLDKSDDQIIRHFIKSQFKYGDHIITEIKWSGDRILVGLNERFCRKKDDDHKSNHQYIVIDYEKARQKCHDNDCKNEEWDIKNFSEFPQNLKDMFDTTTTTTTTKKEFDGVIIQKQEYDKFALEEFHEPNVNFVYDIKNNLFSSNASSQLQRLFYKRGCVNDCDTRLTVSNHHCLQINCTICKSVMTYPIDQSKCPNSVNFWITVNQTVNVTNTVIYQNNGEDNFSCEIDLEPECGTGDLTKLYNQIMDGHKVSKFAELFYKLGYDFVHTDEKRWFYFNDSKWLIDKGMKKFRKDIVEFTETLENIKTYYESKDKSEKNSNIIKNVKGLIQKCNRANFKKEVIEEAEMYFEDDTFMKLLNSKISLVPFVNGVYDLDKKQFRKTRKDDYVNLTFGFEFDHSVRNNDVYDFICKVLPCQQTRDWVLKRMADCLNGSIPNTMFLMFIGVGANGKSQLLNLLKATMGEFGEKVEVTLLTRKRNNANEANPEKMKLQHKRFAFLSEPEDNEKLNVGLLKELTGAEEIVARGLYENSATFVMQCKLFLACNELPEVKGEDTAIWRRIRVVDFPSKFVYEPSGSNEYMIDITLPTKIREDVTWRQTFLNILLEYYYKNIPEPESVRVNTNAYKDDNNETESWFTEHILLDHEGHLDQVDLFAGYFDVTVCNKTKGKFRKSFEKYLQKQHPSLEYQVKSITFQCKKFKGWSGISILSNKLD